MRIFLFVLLLGSMALQGADIMIHTPSLQLVGTRTVNRRRNIPGSGVSTVEKVREQGFRFIFVIQNTSPNVVKLATGFNHIRFDPEPGKNQYVLHLSHRLMSIKTAPDKPGFPLIQPLESFRIVSLRPGEGTLLNVTCWVPEGKVRTGDKLVVEYAPSNHGRYDFMKLKVRSKAIEVKLPGAPKTVTPVVI